MSDGLEELIKQDDDEATRRSSESEQEPATGEPSSQTESFSQSVTGQSTASSPSRGTDSSTTETTAGQTVLELPSRQRTYRSRGLEIVAAGMLSLSVLLGTGAGVLLATPLVVTILYYRVTSLPELTLSATREFSQVAAVPGDRVTVSVTVTNDSERSIPDLRVRDVVPDGIPVVEGSPMATFALQPGASETVTYTVRARRGRHTFDSVEVVCRNASGSAREQRTLRAQRTLVSEVSVESLPLAPRASQYTGRMQTSAGGSGVEFYSTREYHPADSPRNIDWRRYAKTGEFTTIQYKDARAASIHLIVDSRRTADEQVDGDQVTTREMCLYAAELIAENLMESRHEVGLTTVGDDINTALPEKNPQQYQRLRRALADSSRSPSRSIAGSGSSSAGPSSAGPSSAEAAVPTLSLADDFLGRTDSHTQFVCVTGLYDDSFEAFLSRLGSFDRPVFLITPDHNVAQTAGSQLTVLQREMRLDSLRRAGVTVLEWDTEEPLRLALKRLGGVWS